MKPALLVIDIQKQFFGIKPIMTQSLNDAIRIINMTIKLFRARDLPIICIRHMSEEMNLMKGEEGFELPVELDILPSDSHISKTYRNAFTKTSLENELRDRRVDTVIVTGFVAEGCVLATYQGALDHDLTPIVLRGSLASDNLENIRFVENISDIISLGALQAMLG